MNRACIVANSICLAQLASLAHASEAEALHEVVVTGERLSRTLSETASSVAVTTGEGIGSLSGADRIEQVLALTPNVQFGSGGTGPTIRGQDSTGVLRDLPAFLGGTRPRATLQVDGRAVSFNEFVFGLASVWDVERVEVFRSPQTTTQGRNSIGGAIFVETRDPVYDWEGRVRALAGNYDTWQGSAVISGPLVADQLAFRIAGDLRHSRTSSQIADFVAGADPNDDDYGVIRVKLLAEPKALPDARLLTHLCARRLDDAADRGRARAVRGASGSTAGLWRLLERCRFADRRAGIRAWRPSLDSTTTFSWGDSSITRLRCRASGRRRLAATISRSSPSLHWKPAQTLQLLGGVHYLQSQLDQYINLSAVLGEGAFEDRQDSLGMFGELAFQPADRLVADRWPAISSATASSGRGSSIRREQAFRVDFDRTFEAWLPKFSASYEVTGNLRVGALIQRAYNPGGTTLNLDTGEQDDFGAETLWNYEAFARASFAGGRATLSANLFYNDISDAQRASSRAYTVPGGPTAFWAEIDNVPAAESHGLEVEIAWLIGAQLSMRAGLGLLDTRITGTTDPADPRKGNEFQRSPAMTASAAVDWRPGARWLLSAQGRHNEGYYSDDANTAALRIEGTTVLDIRARYVAGRWSLIGYVRNVFDRFYLTELQSPARGTAGDPREFGLGVEAQF